MILGRYNSVMDEKKIILLTGFEPFGGSSINPSQQVALALERKILEKCQVITVILPVDRTTGPQMLLERMTCHNPVAVLCLGEASRRAAISIERIAVNWMDYRIPDNQGEQITDLQIATDGPAAYFSTLPVREIYEQILAAGIPAELSLSAGAYLCNQVFYAGLHHLVTNGKAVPFGFIHLPSLPEQAALSSLPYASMGLETSLRAIQIALDVIDQRT